MHLTYADGENRTQIFAEQMMKISVNLRKAAFKISAKRP